MMWTFMPPGDFNSYALMLMMRRLVHADALPAFSSNPANALEFFSAGVGENSEVCGITLFVFVEHSSQFVEE